MEKHLIKIGLETLPRKLTEGQALNLGREALKSYPLGHKFYVDLFHADIDINGWNGIRINFIHKY